MGFLELRPSIAGDFVRECFQIPINILWLVIKFWLVMDESLEVKGKTQTSYMLH